MVEVNKEKDKLMYTDIYLLLIGLSSNWTPSDVILYYKSELELEFFFKKNKEDIYIIMFDLNSGIDI